MKKVLAELHELINEFEDNGLIAEASTLQEVFVRVAGEADPNDLSEQVKDLLGKYSAPELIAALAEQMEGKDTKTMSFAYGKEPEGQIINEFVDQAQRNERKDPGGDLLKMMNERLKFNGHPALTKEEFLAKVNSTDSNVSNFAFGDEPKLNANGTEQQKMVPVPEQTPEHRQKVLDDFKAHSDEMNKFYKKNQPWSTAPGL
jgi:hypothetical protein